MTGAEMTAARKRAFFWQWLASDRRLYHWPAPVGAEVLLGGNTAFDFINSAHFAASGVQHWFAKGPILIL